MAPIKPLNTNFGRVSLVSTASMPSITPSDATGSACWSFAFGNLLGSSRAGLHLHPALWPPSQQDSGSQ